jgi:2-keto-4-pentenoate hydratase/2-oxohepta-3-ene-1,7-dioic acid hydratase in catechol pathway
MRSSEQLSDSGQVASSVVRIARFVIADQIAYGVVEGDEGDPSALQVRAIDGHPFAPFEQTSAVFGLDDVRLLPPVLPSKIVGIGKNYRDHAEEMGSEVPTEPLMFLKPSTSVVGPGEAVVLPRLSGQVEFEGEIAVVIGRLSRDVPIERADEAILGYACANDVTARDLQRQDGQWTRAKGFDTFCPLGPWIATDVDPGALAVRTWVNGEIRQTGKVTDLVHGIPELVSYVTSVMTLLPGDVILSGTPAGVGTLADGDTVGIEVNGVGQLDHRVVASN